MIILQMAARVLEFKFSKGADVMTTDIKKVVFDDSTLKNFRRAVDRLEDARNHLDFAVQGGGFRALDTAQELIAEAFRKLTRAIYE